MEHSNLVADAFCLWLAELAAVLERKCLWLSEADEAVAMLSRATTDQAAGKVRALAVRLSERVHVF